MKQIYCFTLLFIALFSAQAQQRQQVLRQNLPATLEKETHVHFAPKDLISVSQSVNYGDNLVELNGNVDYFRNVLFPDSTVVNEFANGFGAVWKHSIGQVFDPYSVNMGIFDDQPEPVDTFVVDSVRLFYNYWRYQTAAPDTLVVQVYHQSSMIIDEDPFGTDASIAVLPYNNTTRKGNNPDIEFTYLLEDKDTTTSLITGLTLPINETVLPGEVIAVVFTYFPGNSFNVGDTIDPLTTEPVTNRINAFQVYEYSDNDLQYETGHYNHEAVATIDIRYNQNANGWNGTYLPGTAWLNSIYHLDVDFIYTFNKIVGLDDPDATVSAAVFPNPVGDGEDLHVQLELENRDQVSIELVDLQGRSVKQLAAQALSSGTHDLYLPVEDLAAGAYLCRIEGESFRKTLRTVIH